MAYIYITGHYITRRKTYITHTKCYLHKDVDKKNEANYRINKIDFSKIFKSPNHVTSPEPKRTISNTRNEKRREYNSY